MENKIITTNLKGKWVDLIFLLWLFTLPFGAYLGSFSIGFMTLYPSLIIAFLLFTLTIQTFFQWNKYLKWYFLFLFIWLIYAVIWPSWNSINPDWKFDVRSLFLQFIYTGILFGVFSKIGVKKFKERLSNGIGFFLFVLLFLGGIEFLFGLHLSSPFTDNLKVLGDNYNLVYSPIFIYQNQNDYLVYLVLIISLFIFFKKNKASWLNLFLLFVTLIFSRAAEARIVFYLTLFLIAVQLLVQLLSQKRAVLEKRKEILLGGSILLLFIAMISINETFYKIPSKASVSKVKEMQEVGLKHDERKSSTNVRINLAKNGITFIKEKPILGIGPGQFRHRHVNNSVQYDVGTIVNPHNYPIELVSQYGVFGWGTLLLLGFLFIRSAKKFVYSRKGVGGVLLFVVFGVVSVVPSGFLYLNINWLVVPILILSNLEVFSISNLTDD